MAAEGNPTVQMVLPMAEMVGWLRQGVGELIRQAGLQLIGLLMDEEVRRLVGERGRPSPERKANRWGTERGYCVVMGQKVPRRTAARSFDRRPGDPAGNLRTVPSGRASDGDGLGKTHARPDDAEIRRSRTPVHRSLRTGEERGQRALH